jgi:DNA-binding transcriptional regulator GbsR (MarR family)
MECQFESIAQASVVMETFSKPSRIRIYNLFINEPFLLTEDIKKILGFSQTKANRQLQYLKNAGVLKLKKIKQYSVYQVEEDYMPLIKEMIGSIKDSQFKKDIDLYNKLKSKNELSVNRVWKEIVSIENLI